MNFRQVLNEAVARIVASGEIEKHVEATLTASIKSIITDQFRSYGEFGEQLTAVVKASLKLHGDLDLPSYNDLILKVVRQQVQGTTNNIVQQQVAEQLKKLLAPPPETITLTDLVAKYIDYLKESSRYGRCSCDDGQITLHVEDSSADGWKNIYLDKEKNKSRGDCELEIQTQKDGKVWNVRIKYSGNMNTNLFAGPFFGFQEALFQMKVAGTRVVFDANEWDIDKSYSIYETA